MALGTNYARIHATKGSKGCRRGQFTPSSCNRKAVVGRTTGKVDSKTGKLLVFMLCAKCDAEIGDIIGKKAEVERS